MRDREPDQDRLAHPRTPPLLKNNETSHPEDPTWPWKKNTPQPLPVCLCDEGPSRADREPVGDLNPNEEHGRGGPRRHPTSAADSPNRPAQDARLRPKPGSRLPYRNDHMLLPSRSGGSASGQEGKKPPHRRGWDCEGSADGWPAESASPLKKIHPDENANPPKPSGSVNHRDPVAPPHANTARGSASRADIGRDELL